MAAALRLPAQRHCQSLQMMTRWVLLLLSLHAASAFLQNTTFSQVRRQNSCARAFRPSRPLTGLTRLLRSCAMSPMCHHLLQWCSCKVVGGTCSCTTPDFTGLTPGTSLTLCLSCGRLVP